MLINVMTDALTANPFFLTGYTTFGYVFPPFSIVRKTGIYEPEKPFSLLLSTHKGQDGNKGMIKYG